MDLKELIRAQVREMIRSELNAATAEVIREELGGTVKPVPPTQPAAATPAAPAAVPPTLPKRGRLQRYGTNCYVRVNATFKGPVGAAGSRSVEVWEAIRQHIGEKPIKRGKLMDELGVLLPHIPRGTTTAQVTHLLDGGALVVHTLRIGDATA